MPNPNQTPDNNQQRPQPQQQEQNRDKMADKKQRTDDDQTGQTGSRPQPNQAKPDQGSRH